MHIVIPMSGVGKRFVDAGYNDPKPLIIVEGKPIIQHVVELFPGESKFTFICNDFHLKTTNMRNILLSIVPNANIVEVDVSNRRGPVHAVLQASHVIDDNEEIIVSYCDYGTLWRYDLFKHELKVLEPDGAIPCYTGFHPHMLGSDNYAFVKENNLWMTEIQEKKPFTENKMNEYASNGTYYFRNGSILKKYFTNLIELNLHVNNEFYVSMAYSLMVRDNLNVRVFEIEKMLQWGTPKDLEEYLSWSNYFLHRNKKFNEAFVDKFDTTLILPMAGAGSRFSLQGYEDPKPLLKVEDEHMIVQAVSCLPETKNKHFICLENHIEKYPIKSAIQSKYPESKFTIINEITEGQACTCEKAYKTHFIDPNKPVMISACDNGVYYNIEEYESLVNDKSVDIILWSFSNNATSKLYPHMYAWIDVDKDNFVKRVSVKKAFTDCENKYAIIGTMLFKKLSFFQKGLDYIYKNNIRTNGEFYVDNMIQPLVEMGLKVKIFNVNNYLCWGTPNDYKTYEYWQQFFDIDKNRNSFDISTKLLNLKKQYPLLQYEYLPDSYISNFTPVDTNQLQRIQNKFNDPLCHYLQSYNNSHYTYTHTYIGETFIILSNKYCHHFYHCFVEGIPIIDIFLKHFPECKILCFPEMVSEDLFYFDFVIRQLKLEAKVLLAVKDIAYRANFIYIFLHPKHIDNINLVSRVDKKNYTVSKTVWFSKNEQIVSKLLIGLANKLHKNKQTIDNLWISRRDLNLANYGHKRFCLNINSLADFLSKNEFVEIHFNGKEMLNQIYIVSNAKCIFAETGSAFVNILFMNEKASYITNDDVCNPLVDTIIEGIYSCRCSGLIIKSSKTDTSSPYFSVNSFNNPYYIKDVEKFQLQFSEFYLKQKTK
jgi:NDP-sugar pyrophosphorylase family protein